MTEPEPESGEDPAEVEPTDNSTGAPADLDRVHDLEEPSPDEPGR